MIRIGIALLASAALLAAAGVMMDRLTRANGSEPSRSQLIQHWSAIVEDPLQESSIRQEAMLRIRNQGIAAAEVLPVLIRSFRVTELRDDAVLAIAAQGEQAVDTLRQTLYSSDYDIRMGAARSLGKIGPIAKDAIDDLEILLADPKYVVRRDALRAILAIAPERMPGYVPHLVELMQHETIFYRRWEAVMLLGETGEAGRKALPVLRELAHRWADHPSGFDRLIQSVLKKYPPLG
ncbi:HEAT repeat domain-containing protein [Tuwongella immobilis]|uniref:HEAT repeat domain-containing protein n=1 Tax=Tuwongella immobilis TaxID=692036 RepID=A0A6C2YS20_9BACT|nr:HEAT repeat domain-containing protein [Tuwongella immobilis]VIP04460.1 heat repeat-containing protein : HEAT repeat-containing protein OS=Leptolyngbya sp. PCC 7375 GN=Lepto7375DRAFT_2567 PE=4 SV=1: HEAT_2 [Tuwongella immobilis]VTS06282.1 heat repeat-containing protein : HEAT repeat-containing protein OS=Leptolyngbya sp. PCC 7375 GN=Lepto7375DRAFT_2567 PE=4 SV=1: HEAT_2 [Tuwongella immobilis]